MEIQGACHCGRIGYEAEIDPARVILCHCEDCQISSGGPCRGNVSVLAERFRLLRGEPRTYVKTTAASGNRGVLAFCGDCGSALYSHRLALADEDEVKVLNLRLGAIRQRTQLPPRAQFWCSQAMPWAIVPGLPASPDQGRPEPGGR